MTNAINEIIKLLNDKYKNAQLITAITKKITIAVKNIDDKGLNDLLDRRFEVMNRVDFINKSIQNKINCLPLNARYKVTGWLNGSNVDQSSKISVLNRSIKQEMKRAHTIDKENQRLLQTYIKKNRP